ncbi:MAG TPA: glycoside hydrolase family 6 protein [Cellvibrio sp.]
MFALHSAASHAARCDYVIQSEWGNGFVAAIRITNDTGTAINGWSVNWRYTDGTTRTGSWNANISGNNPFTATGVGWNDRINPGQTVEFGVQGNKGVANSPAQRPVVSGAVCNSATSSSVLSSVISSSSSSIRLSSSASSSSISIVSSSSISSSSITSTSRSSSSTPLLCPQGNSWPDCPPDTWSDAYCALIGPPVCTRNFSSFASSSRSSSSSLIPSSSSLPSSSALPSSSSSSIVVSSSSSSRPSSASSASSIPTDTQPVDNPFIGARWYVDPVWSAKASAEVGGEKVARFNTAVWMDRIGAIDPADGFGLRDHFDAALEQGANLIQVVVYDLPNRDCHALASNGELTQGANGSARYRTEYVDALAAIFSDSKYSRLRIIAIIEPDSLPNLVTNLNDPECQLATDATHGYVANTQYTLNKFAPIPNVYSYVDIGHSGWLGWDDNFNKAVTLIGNAIKGTTNGVRSIAGFVSNTSGYTPIYEPFLDSLANSPLPGSGGGTQMRQAKFYEWNPHFSEVSFVQAWRTKMIAAGFPQSIGMLIDTSRNGWGGAGRPTAQSTSTVLDTFVNDSRVDRRLHRGNWCNQPGGIGERPRATPAPGIDAYVWVKPPGESDGAASLELSYDPLDPAKGFDRMCDPTYTFNEGNSTNLGTGALANAPVAGRWFPEAFQLLVRNAYPALDDSSSSASSSPVSSSSSSAVIIPSSSMASSSAISSSRSSSSQSSSIRPSSSSVASSVVVVSSSRSSSSSARSSSSSSIADRNLYTARKAQVAPVIDGTVDAVWDQASWAPINVFWLGTQPNPGAADYTGQYKALWDENYLYLLFDITDDRIYDRTRDPLSNYWEDDTVEIFIDENKNGGQHQYNTSAWAYHVSTYGDVVDYTTSGPKLLNDHIDVRLVSVGDKHVWEMRVRIYGENYSDSQTNTPLKLFAGKLMGFSASYIDNDGSQQRESMMGSVDTQGHKNNQGYLDAGVFGSMRLVE